MCFSARITECPTMDGKEDASIHIDGFVLQRSGSLKCLENEQLPMTILNAKSMSCLRGVDKVAFRNWSVLRQDNAWSDEVKDVSDCTRSIDVRNKFEVC